MGSNGNGNGKPGPDRVFWILFGISVACVAAAYLIFGL